MSFIPQEKSTLAIQREVQKATRILSTARKPNEEMIRSQFKLIAHANHPDGQQHPDYGGTYTLELLIWAKKILLEDLERRNV